MVAKISGLQRAKTLLTCLGNYQNNFKINHAVLVTVTEPVILISTICGVFVSLDFSCIGILSGFAHKFYCNILNFSFDK